MSTVLVLAMDTSCAAVTAVLARVSDAATECLAERVTIRPRGHGELLAPLLAACLADAGVQPGDLAAVVAGTGPGPFTGLRVGLVTAAVLSATLGIPAYGVCSLDGIAGRSGGDPLLVVTDARRREVYWARYLDGERVDGPAVSRPADVATDAATAMTGAGARLYVDVLGLPLLDQDHPSGHTLVLRAADRIRVGAPGEPLRPRYLRRPDAVEPGRGKAVSR